MGLNLRTKSTAQVCAQAKSQKGFKGTSFTIVSDQQPHPSAAKSWLQCRSEVSQCSNVDCIPGKWGGAAMRHAVEKTFLVAQPVQPVALTSPVACYQSAINKWGAIIDESLQIMVRKGPEGRSAQHSLAHKGAKVANRVGCLLGL